MLKQVYQKYDAFIFDLDGTIYIDNKLIPNAVKTVNTAKELGKQVIFISNKTTGSIKDYYNLLKKNRSEERRVGKGVDLGGRRIIKKKKKQKNIIKKKKEKRKGDYVCRRW